MTSPLHVLENITVATQQDLHRLWAALMGEGSFGRRTLWLVILDDEGRPSPVVVPIDDIPAIPTPGDIDSFGRFVDHVTDCGTAVLLLSRPGPSTVQEGDRLWARALAPLAPRWPVHLAAENAFGRRVITDLSEVDGAVAS